MTKAAIDELIALEKEPYSSEDVHRDALNGVSLDPLRVLATYADEANWRQVYADGRCYWAWDGPTITGYEFAGHGIDPKHVAAFWNAALSVSAIKPEDECRAEFEKKYPVSLGDGLMWIVWQAAWKARVT